VATFSGTIRWHPTDQDAGAADIFDDLHGFRPDRFATRSDTAFQRQIHAFVRTLLQALESSRLTG